MLNDDLQPAAIVRPAASNREELRRAIAALVGQMKQRAKHNLEDACRVGRMLRDMKEHVPTGEWGGELDAMGIKRTQAHNYERCAALPPDEVQRLGTIGDACKRWYELNRGQAAEPAKPGGKFKGLLCRKCRKFGELPDCMMCKLLRENAQSNAAKQAQGREAGFDTKDFKKHLGYVVRAPDDYSLVDGGFKADPLYQTIRRLLSELNAQFEMMLKRAKGNGRA